jgi:hypothetical protein
MEQSTCNTATTNRFSRPVTTRLTIGLSFFVAPPWGKGLDEVAGLDLRSTVPP